MTDRLVTQREPKKQWELSGRALGRLLDWMNEGKYSADAKYLEMHRRLTAYFDRKNCRAPDELADETLNRVARRLEEEGCIESETPAKYCYIVARFVFMEHLRAMQTENRALNDLNRNANAATKDEESERKEKTRGCLDRCLERLESSQRAFILRYYVGKERVKVENRQRLAKSLSISMNALAIRACRIRDKLEACVKECASEE